MNIIKIFFTYFKKDKLKKLKLFIQILICTISTLVFTGMLFNLNNKLDQIKKVTSLSNLKGNFYLNYNTNSSIDTMDSDFNDIVLNLKQHSEDFDFCQFVNQCGIGESEQLYIDNNLNNIINFSVSKGRAFTDEDFNIDYDNDIIPILISSKLEDEYPVGSEFKSTDTMFTTEINYFNDGPTFKVVGILDDNTMFWINDDVLLDKLNYFDIIIYPTNFQKLDGNPPCYLINLKSDNNIYSTLKASFENKYPNIQLIDSSLKDSFINKLQNKIIELIFIGIFTVVLLILSLFGFVSTIQSMILLRHKEIGIHYSLGGTLNNILMFILSEITLIIISATIICYICVYNFQDYLSMNYELLLNSSTFLIALIINCIYILIASIIITFSILKKDPIELLKD